MYKAKIIRVDRDLFTIEIPSLGIDRVEARAIVTVKNSFNVYSPGDLVIVSKLNTKEYIILGCVYIDN